MESVARAVLISLLNTDCNIIIKQIYKVMTIFHYLYLLDFGRGLGVNTEVPVAVQKREVLVGVMLMELEPLFDVLS